MTLSPTETTRSPSARPPCASTPRPSSHRWRRRRTHRPGRPHCAGLGFIMTVLVISLIVAGYNGWQINKIINQKDNW